MNVSRETLVWRCIGSRSRVQSPHENAYFMTSRMMSAFAGRSCLRVAARIAARLQVVARTTSMTKAVLVSAFVSGKASSPCLVLMNSRKACLMFHVKRKRDNSRPNARQVTRRVAMLAPWSIGRSTVPYLSTQMRDGQRRKHQCVDAANENVDPSQQHVASWSPHARAKAQEHSDHEPKTATHSDGRLARQCTTCAEVGSAIGTSRATNRARHRSIAPRRMVRVASPRGGT